MKKKTNTKVILIGVVLISSLLYFPYILINRSESFTLLTPKRINDVSCFTFYKNIPSSTLYHWDKEANLPDLPTTMVLQSEETYNQLLQYKMEQCGDELPKINFKENTILGSYATGNCGVSFKQKVNRDDNAKKVTYTVEKKKSITHCSGAGKQSMNLVVVKKIPDTYTVEFIVK